MKKRNPVAQELRTPKFRKRVVEDKRNKKEGKYSMKELSDLLKTHGPKGKVKII
jgi:hypothetical protein